MSLYLLSDLNFLFVLALTELCLVTSWLLVQFVETILSSNLIPQGAILHFKLSLIFEFNEHAVAASKPWVTVLARRGSGTEPRAVPFF